MGGVRNLGAHEYLLENQSTGILTQSGVDILKVWCVDPQGSKRSELLSLQYEDIIFLFYYGHCTDGAKAVCVGRGRERALLRP